MTMINGPVILLILATITAAGYALYALTHPEHDTEDDTMTDIEPMTDSRFNHYSRAAHNYGTEHAQTHPGQDAPLAGEYAGDLTPDQLMRDIGLDPYETAPEDSDALCETFEAAYFEATDTTEQDTTP